MSALARYLISQICSATSCAAVWCDRPLNTSFSSFVRTQIASCSFWHGPTATESSAAHSLTSRRRFRLSQYVNRPLLNNFYRAKSPSFTHRTLATPPDVHVKASLMKGRSLALLCQTHATLNPVSVGKETFTVRNLIWELVYLS